MTRYILNKLMWVIPSVLSLLVMVFLISRSADDDPIDKYLQVQGVSMETSPNYLASYKDAYIKQGYDKPDFFFSIVPSNYPDCLHCIVDPQRRAVASSLYAQGLNREEVKAIMDNGVGQSEVSKLYQKWHYPSIRWHGMDNQFSQYISKVMQGDWGMSYVDGKSVWSRIGHALRWTLTLVFMNLLMLVIVGIPLVYYAARAGRWIEWVSMFFYIIPLFWLATILQLFFSSSLGLSVLGASRESYEMHVSLLQMASKYIRQYFPALLCLFVVDVAVLVRIIRGNVLREGSQPYVKLAISKGLNATKTFNRHIVRNAMLPLVTLLITSIPASIAGSLILEVVFNIPGMGRLLFQSIHKADWNVVYAIVVIKGIIIMVIYPIGDVLYKWIDPRVKLVRHES